MTEIELLSTSESSLVFETKERKRIAKAAVAAREPKRRENGCS
jgi:hypothetical protein